MSNLKCFAFVHQAWNVEPTPPRIPNPDPDQAEAQNEGSQMPKHYSKHYPKAQGRFRQSVNFVYVFVLNFIRTLLRRKLNTLLACWELEHGSINSFYLLYYIHIFYLSFIPLFVLLFTWLACWELNNAETEYGSIISFYLFCFIRSFDSSFMLLFMTFYSLFMFLSF
jgi:hypothetical protein